MLDRSTCDQLFKEFVRSQKKYKELYDIICLGGFDCERIRETVWDAVNENSEGDDLKTMVMKCRIFKNKFRGGQSVKIVNQSIKKSLKKRLILKDAIEDFRLIDPEMFIGKNVYFFL